MSRFLCLLAAIALLITACRLDPPEEASGSPAPSATDPSFRMHRPTPSPPPSPAPSPTVIREETPILGSCPNRRNNMELAAQKINGTKLLPGETFSFNNVVGPRTEEAGYKEAMIFVEGREERAVGGGICQFSTTLFNAAESAGFTIVERHEHSKDIAYAPDGEDATVSYGAKDLKFTNNSSSVFEISAFAEGDKAVVELKSVEG